MGNCFAASENSVNPVITRPLSPGWSTMKTGSNSNETSELSAISTSTTCPSLDDISRVKEAFPNLRDFTFQELKSATQNFKASNVIGEGGFGRVYKGWVDEFNPAKHQLGIVVAVKTWNPESFQGLQEWKKEVNILGRMSHPNLIKLLGYCWEDNNLLLVYEFMETGSLDNHLFLRAEAAAALQPLSWEQRLKIAVGSARALAFLHASDDRIIHRNFKSSHILLDSDFNPKLSGLGLARAGPIDADSHVSTRVMGTYGYAAPEYIATGFLNAKADVYGFGVVLLEMLSGQRAIDRSRPSKQQLVEFARTCLLGRRKLARLMDPRLEGKYPVKDALGAAQLALRCVANDHKCRPSMDEVVENLEQIEAMKH